MLTEYILAPALWCWLCVWSFIVCLVLLQRRQQHQQLQQQAWIKKIYPSPHARHKTRKISFIHWYIYSFAQSSIHCVNFRVYHAERKKAISVYLGSINLIDCMHFLFFTLSPKREEKMQSVPNLNLLQNKWKRVFKKKVSELMPWIGLAKVVVHLDPYWKLFYRFEMLHDI